MNVPPSATTTPVPEQDGEIMSAPMTTDTNNGATFSETPSSASVSTHKSFFTKCLPDFGGNAVAKGCCALGSVRGSIIMTNLFLSTALIRLAESEVKSRCATNSQTCDDDTVYGFKPSSLITNISVISGVLTAFFMPIIGAILDFTSHRRLTGMISAAFMTVIQGVQIGTLQSTWFPMAILQAVAGFFYNVQVLATFSYLPELGRAVGEVKMTRYTATFTMLQFGTHAMFLLIMVVISTLAKLDDVLTAQVSQCLDTVWILLFFSYAWRMLPHVPPLHELPEGKSILTVGFAQIWRTTKGINAHYGGGLRWFLLAVVFGGAGAGAFTVVSVSYMVEVLDMSGPQIGILFLVSLSTSVVGAKLASVITQKTNPKISWIICLYCFTIVTIAACFVLDSPKRQNVAFLFGILWGLLLGWFYPTENVIFSFILPHGQESELAGFFIYCSQIINWLPPLVFTVMNESGINMRWALMSLTIFFVISIVFMHLMQPWSVVLQAAAKPNILKLYDNPAHGITNDDNFDTEEGSQTHSSKKSIIEVDTIDGHKGSKTEITNDDIFDPEADTTG
eukprot:CAMPEP_0172483266 /NCGR_PEP_ID=MMETSP1066-20121228/10178_1 /TAXON_ID=671091 /ORGANISM="Coscinodiscus wailesii, Strain CCMP2513" /LENGTH=563 /DNA_ID=CAMNT_0013247025 /DNA_START=102 /DNA_END=1793 /DNA_ORIENTATION=+